MNKIIEEDLAEISNEKLDWDSLSGKTILITGANGIIASFLIETLIFLIKSNKIRNTKIIALVRNKEKAEIRFKDYVNSPYIIFLVQDVCEPILIYENINIIIHAASQASPKYYSTDPVGTINPNIIGTTNLLRLAKELHTENFIFFSSAEVYGDIQNKSQISEEDFGIINPTDLRSCYAESKRMGESICYSWYHQFKIPIKIIRPFHTYGPGMSLDDGRIFADFVSDIIKNRNLLIKSDGQARRAYCYLKDAILGCFYVILKGQNGEAYNIGNPSQEYSVKELATILVKLFPEKFLSIEINPLFNSSSYIPSKINRFLPNIDKLSALGWNPTTSISTGFKKTILSY